MDFIMDKQTYADLEIFEEKRGKNAIFKFFNRAISIGGKEELLAMFNHPLSDLKKTQERQDLIRYVLGKKSPLFIDILMDKYFFDFIEAYLSMGNKPIKVSWIDTWHKALKYKLNPTNEYYLMQRGIEYVVSFLQKLYSYVIEDPEQNRPYLLEQMFSFVKESIQNTELRQIIGFNANKISIIDRERFDYIFRYREYDRLKDIIRIVYQLDAFQAIANTAVEFGLIFPELLENKTIEITGLRHLFVENAVANDIIINEDGNMFFLTGANMAGKSTFLKAFGVAVYLAHIGFPVPAASMRTGIFSGLFSTINIADNLNKGYSHFYSEVLRVKNVAEEINQTKNLVVIFDELFRGTNLKDAYDASLAIISAFAKVKGSIFLMSTHIMELAEQLRKLKNIRFGYFHTTIERKTPIYSYRLCDGVTEERLGMLIIENERIVEIINTKS